MKEGNEDRSLLLLYPLIPNGTMDPITAKIEQLVNELIREEEDLFLVEIKIKPTHNIKIFIDGDKGISIEKLVQYNRRLYRRIEETGLFPNGDFSLEVSSP